MHPVVPVLQLIHELKRIEGRKKLQKTVHILRELGAPFKESFQYSYFGMYSAQLKAEIDNLEAGKLVTQKSVFAVSTETVVIESTNELQTLMSDLNLPKPGWIDLAQKLNELQPKVLEGMSTILYLRQTEQDSSKLRERLLRLKPHLAPYIESCFMEVEKLPTAVSA